MEITTVEDHSVPNQDNSEWTRENETTLQLKVLDGQHSGLLVADGAGTHVMSEVTIYKSTVKSTVYKVSDDIR